MQTQSLTTRQMQGCGFAPPAPSGVPVQPWKPQVSGGYAHAPTIEPTTCIGYLRRMPEVYEVARARGHWNVGELRSFAGDRPSEQLVEGVEIYEVASNAVQAWAMTPAKDGGGAG